MQGLCFPENFKVINACGPLTGAGAAVNATPVSLKNVLRLWAVVDVNTVGTSAAVAIVPQCDELVAFGSAISIPNVMNIWVNADVATAPSTFTKATAAVNYTTVGDALRKCVIFEIDPANLGSATITAEYCFRIRFTAVAATDFVSVLYVVEPRYQGRVLTQPTLLTD